LICSTAIAISYGKKFFTLKVTHYRKIFLLHFKIKQQKIVGDKTSNFAAITSLDDIKLQKTTLINCYA